MISHVWPGIHGINVWDLELRMWCEYAAAADEWVRLQHTNRKRG